MASLFDAPATIAKVNGGLLARRVDQPQWQDPASGYIRRVVSPLESPQPMQIIEVRFPPRTRVAFEASRRDSHVHQQVWVLEGEIEIASDGERYRLREGDCLAMQLERPKMFYNPTRKTTRYAIVVASEPTFEK
jgi:quercetin dioxygenase-like cupin family protein